MPSRYTGASFGISIRFAGLNEDNYDSLELSIDGTNFISVERDLADTFYSKLYVFDTLTQGMLYTIYGRVGWNGVTYSTECGVPAQVAEVRSKRSRSMPIYATGGRSNQVAGTTTTDPGVGGGGNPQPTLGRLTPPSGTIAPICYPTVKDQGAYGNCVAMSLSTAMEIFKAKAIGMRGSYENFSVSYIFGSDGQSYDYMMFQEAVNLCITYGSPRWELLTTTFPDSRAKSDAVNLFNTATEYTKMNAKKQAFSGYERINFYDCEAVAAAIRNYGYFMMNFHVPKNFYSVSGDGIVPQPNNWGGAGHSVALIGLTSINGKAYWIAQNSWATWWGNNGLCYIPYDWGYELECGDTTWQSWAFDSYSVWNDHVQTNNPPTPTNLSVSKTSNPQTVIVNWTLPSPGSNVLVYARKRGTVDWYPKPAYSSFFTGTSATISFDNANATYEVMVIAGESWLLSAQSNIVTVGIMIVLPWSWTASNGGASDTQTQIAQITISHQGKLIDFSYLVWNDLIDKIYETAQAYGYVWDTYYATLAETKMSYTDKLMTAKRFNSARYNIGSHYSTGISEVSRGAVINGSIFIQLASKLNEWISLK